MRVLHVVEAFGGGLLRMVGTLAAGSANLGHDVLIGYGVRPETPADPAGDVGSGVELHPLPWTDRSPRAQVRSARALRELVHNWRPDVVHLHSSFAGAIGAAVVPRRVPTVYSPHAFASALPEGRRAVRVGYRLFERGICARATLVGAVSESEAAFARRLGARRVVHVPNGVAELDPGNAVTRAAGWRPEPPLIVASGRTVPQRRPEACARILAAVADVAEIQWLGGGGGRRGVAGARALERAGIPISGWIAPDSLLERVAEASVYLHWTAWDGLSLSVLEAMALDVIVVASDIPPNREVLGAGAVRRDEDEAAALLRRLALDPRLAESMRDAQRSRRDSFGARRMVSRWHEVYASLGE